MSIKLRPKKVKYVLMLVPEAAIGDPDREHEKGTDKDAKILKKLKKFMYLRGSVYIISEWNTVKNERRGLKEMLAFHETHAQIIRDTFEELKVLRGKAVVK